MRFVLGGFLLSLCAMAADFSKADELFEQREKNPKAIHQARAIYESILKSSHDSSDRVHAMNQLGKLALYEGELLLPEEDTEHRMTIFSQCQKNAETVGSAYWKALCLALWSQSAGRLSAWWYLDDFKAAMQRALIEDVYTDEGGIFRLLAIVYSKSKELEAYDLYDLNLALEYANKAIELAPNQVSAYFSKATVLKELGNSNEAKSFVQATLEIFEAKNNLEPEDKVFLSRLDKMRHAL